jgi:HK97 family phage portal protein
MGILSTAKNNISGLDNPRQWLVNLFGGGPTSSGVNVNEDNAITYSAVHNAITIYSEITAMLPLNVYQRLKPRGKEKAQTHPAYSILHDQPNPEMTSFLFRETLMGHLLTYRNAYAEIDYDKAGRVKGLWPLMPDRTWPERDKQTQRLYYKTILPDGKQVKLPANRVFHVPGRSYNGIKGINLIQLMKESIGSGLAMEKYSSKFFSNDGTPGGVLEHPGELGKIAHDNLKADWEEKHTGLDNAHRIAILEEGMKWNRIGVTPEDAQMLESKKFQITEIARWFNMPPHLLKDLERATFSNIEEQSLEFVIYCLTPWLKRWEQQIQKDLISNKNFFAEFLVDALLRGDIESRYNAYTQAIQNGIMSRNEARDKENLNPYPGGDEYMVPLNMMSANMLGDFTGDGENKSLEDRKKKLDELRARRSAAGRRNIALTYEKVIKRSAKKMVEDEVKKVRAEAKKELAERNEGNFKKWLKDFYEDFPKEVQKQMAPVINSLAESMSDEAIKEIDLDEIEGLDNFVRNYVGSFSIRYSRYSHNQLKALIEEAINEDEDPLELIEQRLDEWRERRPGKVAKEESVKSAGAFSKFVFAAGGITKLVWVTMGSDPCPYCLEMDSKVVGIEQNFLNAGDSLNPDDAEGPMQVSGNIGHPPLHEGCECGISPA